MAERRYLGGISLRDAATGTPVEAPVRLSSSSAKLFRNHRGIFVIDAALGLEAHVAAFEAPPGEPALNSLPVTIVLDDPSGTYLPRRFTVRLPRSKPTDLILVNVFRSPRAAVSPNWCTIRGRLVDSTGDAIVAALVRVVRVSDGAVLALSQSVTLSEPTDLAPISPRLQGEIAVPVVGIPVSLWADDGASVLVKEIAVTLEVVPILDGVRPVDPDEHVNIPSLPKNRWNLTVASGRQVNAGTLSVTVP